MELPNRYNPHAAEAKWQQFWEDNNTYSFSARDDRPVYSVDTPPPTVSGDLHLGHCYSYGQTDVVVRFWRMNGYNVYYPMGWDDNGLPTERLVEEKLGIKPVQVGRARFIEAIAEVTRGLEARYKQLWTRLGLSVDWRYTYATISPDARRVSQYSFIDLYNKGLAYRARWPSIWCPTCGTAIAQAEVDDLERQTNFVTLAFRMEDGQVLPIATTRPELLPACVAVFANPDDHRFHDFIGRMVTVPTTGQKVPIKVDARAEPEKGTGVVMCCTFGDSTDVEWWRIHNLPLIGIIGRDGKLNSLAGPYAGLGIMAAREKITADLSKQGRVLDKKTISQTVRVHERCDTPVEYIELPQWFVRILDHKQTFLEYGRRIAWHPAHMQARYEDWVQNLTWDWCISRQRYYGVPFPLWYCSKCSEVVLADYPMLPVDPATQRPSQACRCGNTEFVPETDVMDTWATSSVSPQIAARWLEDRGQFEKLFPMSLRPQAHDIIRTWAFYTVVKSFYHLGTIPWSNIAISGHGLAPEGEKISKSRGGGPIDPIAMIQNHSADAVRYWSASGRLGHDSPVDEGKIAAGDRLVTKLWNVFRFSFRYLEKYDPPLAPPDLMPSDRWVLSRLQTVIEKATADFKAYEYVSAKDEVEAFFWNVLADNYVEMVKKRLYELEDGDVRKAGAVYTLHHALLSMIKMLAPIMPHITEEIYQCHFRRNESASSIHTSKWPDVSSEFVNGGAEEVGNALVGIATQVRRFKSMRQLPMGSPITRIQIASPNRGMLSDLSRSELDLRSITRAETLTFGDMSSDLAIAVPDVPGLSMTIEP